MTLPKAAIDRLLRVLSRPDLHDFVALAKLARLNPRTAFRHLDLRGVRFGGADLTGFDFSGTDLTETDIADSPGGYVLAEDTLLPAGFAGRPPPDFSPEAARDMILAGHQLPSVWRPFVTQLDLANEGPFILALLGGLYNLIRLDLDRSFIRSSDVFPRLPALRVLGLRNTRMSDLASLSHLSKLEFLDLSHTEVADLAPLARLDKLEHLYLSGTQVVDLAPLARLGKLEALSLVGTQVADLTPLASLDKLRLLDLSRARVAGLSPLAHLDNLKHLFLSGTQVADLSPLAGLDNLRELHLAKTLVSDLSPLARLDKLETLNLAGTRVTDASMLPPIPNLTLPDGVHLPRSAFAIPRSASPRAPRRKLKPLASPR